MSKVLSVLALAVLSVQFAEGVFQSGSVSTTGRGCPDGWVANKNSCYLFANRFNGQTWYSAAGFCLEFGAHLVELNDQAEYDFVTAQVKKNTWTDGPWVGMIRLFGDSRWTLPVARSKSNDDHLNGILDGYAKAATHDCGGMDKNGNNFGFWTCRNGGSPVCEIDV